jgi:hypothetical protein
MDADMPTYKGSIRKTDHALKIGHFAVCVLWLMASLLVLTLWVAEGALA